MFGSPFSRPCLSPSLCLCPCRYLCHGPSLCPCRDGDRGPSIASAICDGRHGHAAHATATVAHATVTVIATDESALAGALPPPPSSASHHRTHALQNLPVRPVSSAPKYRAGPQPPGRFTTSRQLLGCFGTSRDRCGAHLLSRTPRIRAEPKAGMACRTGRE